ncbi:hypothetical protein BC332_01680 [Capsicum chinense]|nr:hypothetical protein BC332_01680 [Capsicum chinense]
MELLVQPSGKGLNCLHCALYDAKEQEITRHLFADCQWITIVRAEVLQWAGDMLDCIRRKSWKMIQKYYDSSFTLLALMQPLYLRPRGIEIDDDEVAHFVEHVYRDNNCEQAVIPEGISKHVHAAKYLIDGGVAGAIITAPLDLLKGQWTKCDEGSPESAIKFYSYEMLKNVIARIKGGDVPSLGKLSKEIWIKEGPRTFYKGQVPSLLGIIPYVGIDLAAYETLKDLSRIYILHDSDTTAQGETSG